MNPGRAICAPGSGAFTFRFPFSVTVPGSLGCCGSGVYRTVTAIVAALEPAPASVLKTVAGIVVGVELGTATGSATRALPLGAAPGVPYFHAFSATRKVCSAKSVAAKRFGPTAWDPNFAKPEIARINVPAQIATMPMTVD